MRIPKENEGSGSIFYWFWRMRGSKKSSLVLKYEPVTRNFVP